MWTAACIRFLFLCSKSNRAKSMQNKHLLWTGLFSMWSQPTELELWTVSQEPWENKHLLFYWGQTFLKGGHPSVLIVNTRVSGTSVTCDWWRTSGFEVQEGNHRMPLWKEANSCSRAHRHAQVCTPIYIYDINCPVASQMSDTHTERETEQQEIEYFQLICHCLNNSALPVKSNYMYRIRELRISLPVCSSCLPNIGKQNLLNQGWHHGISKCRLAALV